MLQDLETLNRELQVQVHTQEKTRDMNGTREPIILDTNQCQRMGKYQNLSLKFY